LSTEELFYSGRSWHGADFEKAVTTFLPHLTTATILPFSEIFFNPEGPASGSGGSAGSLTLFHKVILTQVRAFTRSGSREGPDTGPDFEKASHHISCHTLPQPPSSLQRNSFSTRKTPRRVPAEAQGPLLYFIKVILTQVAPFTRSGAGRSWPRGRLWKSSHHIPCHTLPQPPFFLQRNLFQPGRPRVGFRRKRRVPLPLFHKVILTQVRAFTPEEPEGPGTTGPTLKKAVTTFSCHTLPQPPSSLQRNLFQPGRPRVGFRRKRRG